MSVPVCNLFAILHYIIYVVCHHTTNCPLSSNYSQVLSYRHAATALDVPTQQPLTGSIVCASVSVACAEAVDGRHDLASGSGRLGRVGTRTWSLEA